MKKYLFIILMVFIPTLTIAQEAGGQLKRPIKKQSGSTTKKSNPSTKRHVQNLSSSKLSEPVGSQFIENNYVYKVLPKNEVEIGIYDRGEVGTTLYIPQKVVHKGVSYTVTAITYSSMQSLEITSLSIPPSIRTIGSMAFWHCKELETIYIPASTTLIDPSAFSSCSSLVAINVDSKNPMYCSDNNVLMTKNRKFLILYPARKPGENYIVPSSVESIAEYAFEECKLKSITIPMGTFYIPASAFSDCKYLSNITISTHNPNYYAPNNVLLTKDGKNILRYPAGKTDNSYVIPSSVENIAWGAFSSCRLESIIIDNDNITIEKYAFRDSPNLKTVIIPQSVVSRLPEKVFSGCNKLGSISVKASTGNIMLISADAYK